MRKIVLALIVAFAFGTTAMAGDIAISTDSNWWGQAAADREAQEIVDNVTGASVELFGDNDQAALADWVTAHTGDGVSDVLILCGKFPATIYPAGNAEPDGSIAELFLDDGNTIINTGDWMFYVGTAGNNATEGLHNMMDIPGVDMSGAGENIPCAVTAEGNAVAPSLQALQTDRPFHLDTLGGDWVPELILAQNDDGTLADPVIVVNTVTGGRIGIFYQTNGQDNDPRGEVMSEWINNWYLTDGVIPNAPAWKPNPADGAIEVDTTALEWTMGYGAVKSKVYLSADATIDDADLLGETDLELMVALLDPGATYYWRVDEVAADDSVTEGPVWSFTTLPLEAHFPDPVDGVINAISLTLSWTPGKNAIMHNVHYGTDPAMLLPVQMMSMDTSYDPGPLDPDTTYYWRVDEFGPAGTVAGPVWSFSTVPTVPAADGATADMVAWYPLAEDASSLGVLDVSGNNNHGALVGNLAFVDDPDMGQVLSLPGGSNQFVDCGSVGISGTMERTIMCWAKADHTSIPDWTLIFGFTGNADGGGGNGSHFNIGSLGGPGGVGAHCWGWEETIFSDQEALEWRHYAMTYDGTTIRYYGDGKPMDTDVGKSNVMDLSASADRVHIGSRVTQDSSFPGKVSDARIYNRVLTDEEIRQIGSDVAIAWSPEPADGASGLLATDVVMSWNPGEGAQMQDVYLGTDAAAVAAANAGDTTGIYRGRQAEIAYAPDDAVWGTTNYWRVDQVTVDGSTTCIAKGTVWSFSTAVLIPASANLGACETDVPGFLIRSLKAQSEINNFGEMNAILDTGLLDGLPPVFGSEGTRIDEFCNVRDTGNGAFDGDKSFPGIDALEDPAADPADGDDDNDFATEILGCIQLTAGAHRIGTATDDGVIVWIGGIEIGRSGALKGDTNHDMPVFQVEVDGYYEVKARTFERGGGASAELHEILPDGTRILLNDVASGGSAVFAPPAPEGPAPEPIGGDLVEDFESYAVGTDLHGVNDWEGWEGAAGAGAPVSATFASSGSNSVEIIGTADLVKKLDYGLGSLTLTAMQYIPSGTTGNTFFILMNQYAPNPLDWSCQTKFSLASGQINDGGGTIVYDQWVELKYVIDLDNNTVDEYYNGVVIRSGQWDDTGHKTLQAIDLYSEGASSVYYDDITITR